MESGIFIVPGAEVSFRQRFSGDIFRSKNAEHIGNAAPEYREAADQAIDGTKKDAHAVDKKHKYGGVSHTGLFAPPE